ncbi:uncharacterized protein NPIL_142281 [Nephila pilipes]|uniref:Uncharacterized protein n=1 Tax=Nephila pilipes TaxID=299642 RepID=A0A8X6Q8N0_NEPPI|nr:uncharacterized protein NPIL_142281 [Nephila pilipes]
MNESREIRDKNFNMKSKGVDSAESWRIAAASIIINFLILAPARLSGVLFVAFMDRYNVDREQASLPFTLCYILRTLPGPLAGYLAETFGLRRMSIIGCVLSTVGVASCFLADDIITVTILLGGCYGLGYGFVCSLIPEFLNQYFDKHLAKANGLTMGGAGLGAFVIPPIVEILIHVYGVSGMLLIFGGMVLHSVPATMLLRRANFDKKSVTIGITQNVIEGGGNSQLKSAQEHEQSDNIFSVTSTTKSAETAQQSKGICNVTKIPNKHLDLAYSTNMVPSGPNLVKNEGNNPFSLNKLSEQPSKLVTMNMHFSAKDIDLQSELNKQAQQSSSPLLLNIRSIRSSIDIRDLAFDFKMKTDKVKSEKLIEPKVLRSSKRKQNHSPLQSFRVFTDPAFLLITLIQSTYFFIMFLIWTIVVDFVRDKGITPDEEVYFVMCLSLSDTLGRLGLGWITDSGLLTIPNYSAICFFGMAVFCLVLPWTSGFYGIICTLFTYGFISGGVMIIFPGMITQFVHKDLRTMAMASRTILNAPMSMTISPLIGKNKFLSFYESHALKIYVV